MHHCQLNDYAICNKVCNVSLVSNLGFPWLSDREPQVDKKRRTSKHNITAMVNVMNTSCTKATAEVVIISWVRYLLSTFPGVLRPSTDYLRIGLFEENSKVNPKHKHTYHK